MLLTRGRQSRSLEAEDKADLKMAAALATYDQRTFRLGELGCHPEELALGNSEETPMIEIQSYESDCYFFAEHGLIPSSRSFLTEEAFG